MRRYKKAAEKAHAQYLAALHTHAMQEQKLGNASESGRQVFDGRDASELDKRAGADAAKREKDMEQRVHKYAAVARLQAKARLVAEAARAESSASAEAAEEAKAEAGAGRVYTTRDKEAADAAAAGEARTEETTWQKDVARYN